MRGVVLVHHRDVTAACDREKFTIHIARVPDFERMPQRPPADPGGQLPQDRPELGLEPGDAARQKPLQRGAFTENMNPLGVASCHLANVSAVCRR
jgi:hypothetical protein